MSKVDAGASSGKPTFERLVASAEPVFDPERETVAAMCKWYRELVADGRIEENRGVGVISAVKNLAIVGYQSSGVWAGYLPTVAVFKKDLRKLEKMQGERKPGLGDKTPTYYHNNALWGVEEYRERSAAGDDYDYKRLLADRKRRYGTPVRQPKASKSEEVVACFSGNHLLANITLQIPAEELTADDLIIICRRLVKVGKLGCGDLGYAVSRVISDCCDYDPTMKNDSQLLSSIS